MARLAKGGEGRLRPGGFSPEFTKFIGLSDFFDVADV
jgi:hypothetical protein